ILQSTPRQAGIPLVRDVLPASDHPLLELVMSVDAVGLALVGPAGMPAERTEILRQAFLAMTDDEGYRADAARADQPVGAPIAAMIDQLAAVGATDAVAAYKRLRSAR